MGWNRDLISEIGLPREITCPACKKLIQTSFSDVDVEGGDDCNPAAGVWELDVWCYECEHKWHQRFEITVEAKP